MSHKATKNLHIPLSGPSYEELRRLAEQLKTPATRLAREAIEFWLERQRQRALHQSIMRYAGETAGTEWDLDPALEAASLEFLLREEKS